MSYVGLWPVIKLVNCHETHDMRFATKIRLLYSHTTSCVMPTLKLKVHIYTMWCQSEICPTSPDTDDRFLERQKGSFLEWFQLGMKNKGQPTSANALFMSAALVQVRWSLITLSGSDEHHIIYTEVSELKRPGLASALSTRQQLGHVTWPDHRWWVMM